ncbi:dTDP-4-dehydrorhamnose reductase [Rhizobium sp. ARZ01]|uniref:dTDP-4-dehydrorhamnose reductase n=1 Tax=Rhizobium sp. ARZ01 TaxID=2769313 RepID=UPI001783FD84|nr:dTDP-4-dehydrorhamnose reductase [Rhizobium sp. ARZ01]MBD9374387.1 dTDP-4-dehydrorhamnose reductase [Rhizobium sp. ARZ01]
MRILVTGRHGQLATSLVEITTGMSDITLVAVGRPDLELSDPSSIRRVLAATRPDIVVSAAAYTAVDRAEDERDLAYDVNVVGAANIAEAAAQLRLPIIHVSTDYVFSGDSPNPYLEDDETEPRTVYGYTKLRGELAVASANPRHVILRTSWVYSPFGTNFVRTMLRLATERRAINVVADQWGNPTSAIDLARAIIHVATHPWRNRAGVFHVTGMGEANWSGFARHVFRTSQSLGGPFADVIDIASAEYRTKAKRPSNSRLSCDKFEQTFGWRAPAWQASTDAVVRRLVQAEYPHYHRSDG